MIRCRKSTRLISWLLVVAMVFGLMGTMPALAASAPITNESLRTAIDEKYNNPNDLGWIDLTDWSQVVGTVDLAELKAAFPSLQHVILTGTNVSEIIDSSVAGSGLSVEDDRTFTANGGKYFQTATSTGNLVYDFPSNPNLAKSVSVMDLLKLVEVKNYNYYMTAADLAASNISFFEDNLNWYVGYQSTGGGGYTSRDNGSTTLNGTIPLTVLQDGERDVTVRLELTKNDVTSSSGAAQQVFTFNINMPEYYGVVRQGNTDVNSVDVYVDSSATFTVYKYFGNALQNVGEQLYFKYSAGDQYLEDREQEEYSLDPDVSYRFISDTSSQENKRIVDVTVHAKFGWPSTPSGTLYIYEKNPDTDPTAEALCAVGINVRENPGVSNLQLVEYNNNRIGDSTTGYGDTIYIDGGTAFASLDSTKVSTYQKETLYLVKGRINDTGELQYLPAAYLTQMLAEIAPGRDLDVSFQTVPNPDNANENVVAVRIFSNEIAGRASSLGFTLRVAGTMSMSARLELNVQSFEARDPVAFEIYRIPSDRIGMTKDQIEAAIADEEAGFDMMVRIPADTLQSQGTVTLVEGDAAYLVAVAQYAEGGPKFLLDTAYTRGWNDGDGNAISSSGSGTMLKDGVYALSNDINLTTATDVLSLSTQRGTAEYSTNLRLYVTDNAVAGFLNIPLTISRVQYDDYIWATTAYTNPSNDPSYYSDTLATENGNNEGTLYELNTLGEISESIGGSISFKVIGITNHLIPQEDVLDLSSGLTWSNSAKVAATGSVNTNDNTVYDLTNIRPTVTNDPMLVGDQFVDEHDYYVTLSYAGDGSTVTVRLGPSDITGAIPVYQDVYGNLFTAESTIGLVDGEVRLLDSAFELPAGRTATVYMVYRYANESYYSGTAQNGNPGYWRDNIVSSDVLRSLSSSSSSVVAVTGTGGTSGFTATAANTSSGQSVTLNGSLITTSGSVTVAGKTHEFRNTATAVDVTPANIACTDAIPVAVASTGIEHVSGGALTSPPAAVANGSSVQGGQGETLGFNLVLQYSNGDTRRSDGTGSTAISAEDSAKLKLLVDDRVNQYATVDETGLNVKLMQRSAGIPMYVQYTDTSNGLEYVVNLLASSTSSSPYTFDIDILAPAAQKLYLVAAPNGNGDTSVEVTGRGSNFEVTKAEMGDIYRIYPVILDSTYTLSSDTTINPDTLQIGYQDVESSSYLNYVKASEFNTSSAAAWSWSVSPTIAGVEVATDSLKTDENGYVYYEMLVSSSAQSGYEAALLMTSAALSSRTTYSRSDINLVHDSTTDTRVKVTVNHMPDRETLNVVDVVATPTGSTSVQTNEDVTYNIQYGVNIAVADGSTTNHLVNPTFFRDDAISGYLQNGNSRIANVLVVENACPLPMPTVTGSGNQLTFSTSIPGEYVFNIYTYNNAGLQAPISGPVELRFEVIPAVLSDDTVDVYYDFPKDVSNITSRYARFVRLEEAGGANQLNISGTVLEASNNIRSSTTVNIIVTAENGAEYVAAQLPVEIYANTPTAARLSILTAATSPHAFEPTAPNNEAALYWIVTYPNGTKEVEINSATFREIQADGDLELRLDGKTVTANGTQTGRMLYKAEGNYGGLSLEGYFWAEMVNDGTIQTEYVYSSNPELPLVEVSQLNLTRGEQKIIAVFDKHPQPSPIKARVASVSSSDTNVVEAEATNGDITLRTKAEGAAVIRAIMADGRYAGYLTVTVGAAQTYSISGTVNDSSTGSPINGATVTISGNAITADATTDSTGSYSISGLESGVYTVTASATGYTSATQSVMVSNSNAVANFDLNPIITPPPATYTITVQPGVNGTVSADRTSAAAGDTVTVNVTADTGYTISGVSVQDDSGNAVSTTEVSTGEYTFSMPASNVTVSASFTATGGGTGGGGTGGGGTGGGGTGGGGTGGGGTGGGGTGGGGTGGGGTGGAGTTHSVTVQTPANGSVSVDMPNAQENEIVTVTATPNTGYTVSSVTVRDGSGSTVTVTENADGTYSFRMPASNVTISVSFAAEGSQTIQFNDVAPSAWYYSSVMFAAENKYMNGIGNNLFSPQGMLTRAMMVQTLYNMEGQPAVSGASSYRDVVSGAWYTNAIIWATENNIVNGYDNGNFGVNDNITREQLVTILHRYTEYKGGDVSATASISNYTDAGQVSAYANNAVMWAVAEGLLNGRTSTTLEPRGNATRAEVATIIERYCS